MKKIHFSIKFLVCFVFAWTYLTSATASSNTAANPADAPASTFQAQPPAGSWTPTGGPFGGTANGFVTFPDGRLMVGTGGGGVGYSMDNGENFQMRNNGLTNLNVNALLLVGTAVFAATLGGVFRTENRGFTWTPINVGLTVLAVLALSYIGSTLFAGTNGGGLFIFNGQSWEQRNNGLTNLRVNAIKAIGAFIVLGTAGGIFRSNNSGGSWLLSNAGLTLITITALACIGTTLFAGTEGAGVFRSTNEGASWQAANTGASNLVIRCLLEDGARLLAGATAGLFGTTTNGSSWNQLGTGSLPGTAIRAILIVGARIFAGCFASGVYRSDNQGQNFAEKNRGLAAVEVRGLGVATRTNCAGFAAQQICFPIIANTLNGPVISYDGGRTWTVVKDGLPDTASRQGTSLAVTESNVYNGNNGGLHRMPVNGPFAWTKVNGVDAPLFLAASPSIINIATPNGLYRLLEGSPSAERVTTNGLTNLNVQTAASINNATYIGTNGGGVFELVGDRWEQRNGGELTDLEISALLAGDGALLTGNLAGEIFKRRLPLIPAEAWKRKRSSNGRRIHRLARLTLLRGNLIESFAESARQELQAQTSSFILAGSLGDGALISTDEGETWQPLNNGLGNLNVFDVAVANGQLYAATGGGVYVFTSPVASVSAASFSGTDLAAESIVAAFGSNLATATQIATTVPLPTQLAGTQIRVLDSLVVERLASQFFVAPTQANFQMPPGTAPGLATITITNGNGFVSKGTVNIANVSPGLFTANSSGSGVPAAVALRVKADGSQIFEPVARFDSTTSRFVAIPIDLGPESDQVFLIPYGTGIKNRSALSAVTAQIGGAGAEVLYAGPQGDFVGLDQVNIRLSRNLIGRGEVDVALSVDGRAANTVRINIK